MRDEPTKRELTADELDVEGMVGNMHFRVGGALLGSPVDDQRHARALELQKQLFELVPFLKALGYLALENPGRTRELWAQALREPMPFGLAPVGMPTK